MPDTTEPAERGAVPAEQPATQPAERVQIAGHHRELLDQVLDKWSLQVLDELCERPLRFNELRRAIPVVTQKSLTATLRRLERNGMVDRVLISSRPIAVEYRIAALGRTLQDLIDALFYWSAENLADVELARSRFDTSTQVGSGVRGGDAGG